MFQLSSNINEVIRTVLNSLFSAFLFYKKILHAPKSTNKHQKAPKAQKHNQAKAQKANKQTKSKNALKKHLNGKK